VSGQGSLPLACLDPSHPTEYIREYIQYSRMTLPGARHPTRPKIPVPAPLWRAPQVSKPRLCRPSGGTGLASRLWRRAERLGMGCPIGQGLTKEATNTNGHTHTYHASDLPPTTDELKATGRWETEHALANYGSQIWRGKPFADAKWSCEVQIFGLWNPRPFRFKDPETLMIFSGIFQRPEAGYARTTTLRPAFGLEEMTHSRSGTLRHLPGARSPRNRLWGAPNHLRKTGPSIPDQPAGLWRAAERRSARCSGPF
jgi:hypothetical protein